MNPDPWKDVSFWPEIYPAPAAPAPAPAKPTMPDQMRTGQVWRMYSLGSQELYVVIGKSSKYHSDREYYDVRRLRDGEEVAWSWNNIKRGYGSKREFVSEGGSWAMEGECV